MSKRRCLAITHEEEEEEEDTEDEALPRRPNAPKATPTTNKRPRAHTVPVWRRIEQFPDQGLEAVFDENGDASLYCRPCSSKLNMIKQRVLFHVQTVKHMENKQMLKFKEAVKKGNEKDKAAKKSNKDVKTEHKEPFQAQESDEALRQRFEDIQWEAAATIARIRVVQIEALIQQAMAMSNEEAQQR